MPQTSVPTNMTLGSAGQVADEYTAHNGDALAGTNEEASASIPFGCLAFFQSAEGVRLPASLANVKLGCGVLIKEEVFDVTTQLADVTVNTNAQSAIKVGVTGSFLRKGRILVIPEDTGTMADGVFVRISGAGQLGSFRRSAVVGQTVVLTPFARWLSTPTAGQPTVLELDLTNVDLATAS
jgi:hypothetical protein